MKKFFCTAISFALLLSLAACTQSTPSDPATKQTQPTTAAPAPDHTEPDTGSTYTLSVKSHDALIFDAPTYDGRCVGTVREAGVYTIVEEATDDEGNRWGKLKSGAGWLDLGQVEATQNTSLLMTAAELTYEVDNSCILATEPGAYSTPVILHAYADLTNVRLYSLCFNGETYEPAEPLYVAETMNSKTAMVAHLEFTGDMTMFGVSFQDAAGNFHHYRIATNGRNNALSFTPYQPT